MIIFKVGKAWKVHISRPSYLELVAFALVLSFFLIIVVTYLR